MPLTLLSIILVVACVVHAEGKGQNSRLLREDIIVEASQYLFCCVAAYATVCHPQTHLWEMRHVVEPDVGVVMPAIGDAVAHECHAIALLEGCDALCLNTDASN